MGCVQWTHKFYVLKNVITIKGFNSSSNEVQQKILTNESVFQTENHYSFLLIKHFELLNMAERSHSNSQTQFP